MSLLLAKMSYRYPHEDDSDENGFGESLQQSSGAQPHDSSDSDDDVFEPATEVTEDDQDEDENDSDYEDEEDEDEDEDDEDAFHGQWWPLSSCADSLSLTDRVLTCRCRDWLHRRSGLRRIRRQ